MTEEKGPFLVFEYADLQKVCDALQVLIDFIETVQKIDAVNEPPKFYDRTYEDMLELQDWNDEE